MKKTFLKISLLFALIISSYGFAQQGTSEVNFKYGAFTHQDISGYFDNVSSIGSITGGYDYFITDKISLGASLTYQNFNKTFKTKNDGSIRINSNWFIPMANAKYLYLNNKKLQLYGKAGLGYALVNTVVGTKEVKNQNKFAFQVTPIGLRYGNKFGVLLEAGYGYQGGVASGGVSFKL